MMTMMNILMNKSRLTVLQRKVANLVCLYYLLFIFIYSLFCFAPDDIENILVVTAWFNLIFVLSKQDELIFSSCLIHASRHYYF